MQASFGVQLTTILEISALSTKIPPQGDGIVFKKDKKTIDWEKTKAVGVSEIDSYLSNGDLIVAQVYNPSTGGNHWVLVTGKKGEDYRIIDPGCYEERKTLSGVYSNNIYRFVAYKRTR